MQLSTILSSILKLFATSPDLCDDVYVDATGEPYTDSIGQTLSRYCQWTGPNAPELSSDVCCDIADGLAACVLPDSNGRCVSGDRYACKYGQVIGTGVVCYQPFPDACDGGHCVAAPELPPPMQEDTICCTAGVCIEVNIHNQNCEDNGGVLSWCSFGHSNEDGTVTCFDL
jgi:hypothetical protein